MRVSTLAVAMLLSASVASAHDFTVENAKFTSVETRMMVAPLRCENASQFTALGSMCEAAITHHIYSKTHKPCGRIRFDTNQTSRCNTLLALRHSHDSGQDISLATDDHLTRGQDVPPSAHVLIVDDDGQIRQLVTKRSEERRVGKEC